MTDPDRHAAVAETHVSTLFFLGDRVLKVHKPVHYGFVDLRSRARRQADCRREVALNRRLAPDVYLGTADIVVDGRPVEHAVVMRRLPATRSLAALVETGAEVADHVARVAETLAGFHERADRSPAIDAAATPAALWQRWQATEEELGPFVGPVVEAAAYRELTALAGRYLRGRGPLFARRITDGQVCDGHGDLQAADVFCLEDGPRLLDCLEFDDQLRHGDGLADVAFLAADLESLGAAEAAAVLVTRYQERTGSAAPASLLDFYVAARAHVRLLVACLQRQQGIAQRSPAALLGLALRHARRALPRLVLVGGPPGSGKSTLAGWLGAQLGATVLSTDHLRRETASAGYSDAERAAVYRRLVAEAGRLLALGETVVADATWAEPARRAEAAAAAAAATSELVQVACTAPGPVREQRVADRLRAGAGESEATPAVTRALGSVGPWPGALAVDTSGPVEATRWTAGTALAADLGRPLAK